MGYINHYRKWHNHNDPGYVNYIKRKFTRAFGEHLPADKDAAILEIGCSNGMALYALKDLGYTNLLGIEIDEELARIAQSFSLPVEIHDATTFIKNTKKKFDFIYMFDVLEHFDRDRIPSILKDLFKLLNEDGKLMLIIPNATSPAGSYFRYIDWTHKVSFTATSISYLLEEAGFKDITITDESLIEEPVREDFDSDESFENAKKRSERARFYEAFARWEMISMFGPSPYNLLVAPNMKVVACKKNNEKTNLKIDIKNDNSFDLQDLSNQVTSINRQIEDFNIRFRTTERNINNQVKKILSEVTNLKNEADKTYNKLIMMEEVVYSIKNQAEKDLSAMKSVINDFKRSNQAILNYYKKIALKKRKKVWWRIYFRLRSYKLRRIIESSPYFDKDYYLKKNPDVLNSGVDPILHYMMYGVYEGRNPSDNFNTDEYIRSHPETVIDDINPIIHKLIYEKN